MEYDPDTHSLKCPKCGQGMEEVTHDSVTIDRCTYCEGLWFDAGEFADFKQETLLDYLRDLIKGKRGTIAP